MSFTGNSTYANHAAFAIEQSLTKKWSMLWTSSHPFIAILAGMGLNFNQGITVNGLKGLLPVMGDDQTVPVAGVASGSTEISSPMTPNYTAGFSQYAFNFAHYRGNYTILESEAKLIANGTRGDLLEGKRRQLQASFMNAVSNHFASATADAADNSRPMGIYYPLSTSNTVGGISQSTDTQTAAYVKSSAGPFDLSLVDDAYHSLKSKGNVDRDYAPDVALASYSTTNDVYGKWKSAIAPNLRYSNDTVTKYGVSDNFVHAGGGFTVAMDSRIADTLSGSIALLSSATWYVYMDKKPRMHAPERVAFTDGYEVAATAWVFTGCNDPGMNALIRDIT